MREQSGIRIIAETVRIRTEERILDVGDDDGDVRMMG